jgi:hypothetical protein
MTASCASVFNDLPSRSAARRRSAISLSEN